MMLLSLTGDVIRHTRTVLIKQTGDGKEVFMCSLIGAVASILCAYILTTHVLSVQLIIARCNEFAPHSTDFGYLKRGRVVLNSCVQRNRELHRRRDR